METDEIKAMCLAALYTQKIKISNAVVALTGNNALERVKTAAELVRDGWGEILIITGDDTNNAIYANARAASAFRTEILNQSNIYKLESYQIIADDAAKNTHEQGTNTIEFIKGMGFHSLIIVTDSYHLPRAFMTFLTAMDQAQIFITMYGYVTKEIGWFHDNKDITAKFKRGEVLFPLQLQKIAGYQAKGHVASWERTRDYLAEIGI